MDCEQRIFRYLRFINVIITGVKVIVRHRVIRYKKNSYLQVIYVSMLIDCILVARLLRTEKDELIEVLE